MAWMAARGRQAIVSLGGPGRPDILSLTRDGRLVRTEVKGTFAGTQLGESGLFRRRQVKRFEQVSLALLPQIWDGKGPANETVLVAENSRDWISITAGSILRQLDEMVEQLTDPILRRNYTTLSDKFRSSYLDGRLVDEDSEVIQVGLGIELPDPRDSIKTYEYLAEAKPTQVVQINVRDPD
jgi:hypothetical protein